ncbi:hypothetical protein HUJ04_010221 [Dendroctonus ponderosae]|nr:hypothetical protein HUJ04_010221 [Dendroctonus ponderosae]
MEKGLKCLRACDKFKRTFNLTSSGRIMDGRKPNPITDLLVSLFRIIPPQAQIEARRSEKRWVIIPQLTEQHQLKSASQSSTTFKDPLDATKFGKTCKFNAVLPLICHIASELDQIAEFLDTYGGIIRWRNHPDDNSFPKEDGSPICIPMDLDEFRTYADVEDVQRDESKVQKKTTFKDPLDATKFGKTCKSFLLTSTTM